MGEACVIGFEESADVFALSLMGFVNGDAILDDLKRVKHESNSVQQVLASGLLDHILIKLLLILPGDDVPSLGATLMVIVNRIEPQILDMPTEGRKPHSHINPRHRNATDKLLLLIGNLEDRVGRLIRVIQVIKA